MKPRRTHQSNQVFTLAGGTEDNDLWATVAPHQNTVTVTSVWEPTPEERQQIADGANIALTIWGGQPPVAMRTDTVPLGKPPTG